MSRRATIEHILDAGVVAVVRVDDPHVVLGIARALVAGGIRALEITMTVPGAVGIIGDLASKLDDNLVLGAGTVLEAATAREVIRAGARFVVSPVFDVAVIDAAHTLDAAAMPGCFTPTEVVLATRAGADLVKVFPAGVIGPAFIRDLLAPLPHVRLMPTGGVTIANAPAWIRAGAVAVGIGTALLDPAAVREGRLDVITDRARELVESIRVARGGDAPAVQT
jgi:2-dehydro-3-deoxyphosphogluconate aldolase/(4S)-4-hydroxy-2-oxoglutarate aldolase